MLVDHYGLVLVHGNCTRRKRVWGLYVVEEAKEGELGLCKRCFALEEPPVIFENPDGFPRHPLIFRNMLRKPPNFEASFNEGAL